jgi:hypothetical protein
MCYALKAYLFAASMPVDALGSNPRVLDEFVGVFGWMQLEHEPGILFNERLSQFHNQHLVDIIR